MRVETKEDYNKFIKYLLDNKPKIKEADKKRHINIICSSYTCLHYKMADIRKIAKEVYSDGFSGLIEHSKNVYYEEVLIKGLVIAHIRDKEDVYNKLQNFIPLIDSWSICDSVISSFDAFKKGADNEDFNRFIKWAESKEEFTSRFGLMMIFRYFIKKENLGDIFKLLLRLKSDAYYTKMGAAWLVSELMIKFPLETEKFLSAKKLDRFTQNKAISKCHDSFRLDKETKKRIKTYRIIGE